MYHPLYIVIHKLIYYWNNISIDILYIIYFIIFFNIYKIWYEMIIKCYKKKKIKLKMVIVYE